jgi:putative ubiquitin-RnfH superfamily antitoxin RatB of RatAB toxin-antitoxin module
LRIEVVYSPAERTIDRVELELPAGGTVADALAASGLLQRHPGIDLAVQRVGVWGRPCSAGEPLQDGDRVELYRALKIDPKEARRLRQRRQGGSRKKP